MFGWLRSRRGRVNDADWKYWYASELLDDATCPECREVDGKKYPTRRDADRDYEYQGGFKRCTNPQGCRGTLVGVSIAEKDPPS